MDTYNTNNEFAKTATIKRLNERLNEERTVQAIDKLLDRIDTLENAVANLSTIMDQGPGMLAMATDIADETYRKANSSGISLENRFNNALHIAEKLTAPAMVEKLDHLLQLVDQAPGLIAMTTDVVDDTYRRMSAQGINIENRLAVALNIAEKLTTPAMVEKLDNLLQLADQAPGLIAMTVDMVDEEMGKVNNSRIDIPALLEVGKQLSSAVTKSRTMADAKVGGIFSMLKTMRDPDRQRAIGYLMNIAKAFGQELKHSKI